MWYLHKKMPEKIGTGWYFGFCLAYIFTFRFFIEYTKEIQEAFEASLPIDMGPWMFIRRITFAYHYFAAAVFLIPCLCYVFRLMERSSRLARIMTIVFTVLSVFLFVLFFPVLNGLPVAHETAKTLFTWLKTWPI